MVRVVSSTKTFVFNLEARGKSLTL